MAITKVTNSLVATNAIQGTLIADNAITSVHIAQNQVTAVQIPDGSITATQLGANSVDSSELVDGSIDTSHIADAQITTAKLGTNQVTSAKIAQNSVEARHIADGSITDTQLGSGAFTMGNITTTGSIRGPASLTIDPATVGDNTGTVVIAGNLQVDGTTTTVNSTTVDIVDKNITLGKGGNASANNGGGITIDGAAATLLYTHSGTKWSFNKPLDVTGAINSLTLAAGGIDGPVSNNFAMNSPNSLRINIDSNASNTGESFIIGKDQTAVNQSNILVKVQENGRVAIGNFQDPDADLEVRGSTVISTASDGVNSILMGLSGTNRTTIQLDTADTTHTNRQWGITNIAGDLYIGRHGLSVMTMKNDGKVGIGTSSPSHELEIHSASPTVEWSDSDNNYRSHITQSGSAFYIDSDAGAGGSSSMRFRINGGNEAMRISSSGNVGMGTTSPSSKLHVKHGDIRLEGNAESGQDITFTITNDNSGNEVEAGLIRFIDTGGGQSNRGAAIASYMPTADTGDLRFYTSAGADRAERMRINSVGTIYQGTTTPILHSASRGIVFENGSIINDVTRGAGKSITLAQNAAVDSGNTWAYLATDEASYYQQFGGNHYFGTAPSGSAGADTTFTTRLHVRNDGGVAIGAGNAGYSSQILSVKSGAADEVLYGESTDANCFAVFRDNSSNTNVGFGAIGNDHVFRNDSTEKWRMQASTGYLIGQSASQVRLVLGSTGNSSNNTSNWIRGTGNELGLNSGGGNIGIEIGGSAKATINTTGQILLNSLATSTPTFSFINDPDTGMSRPTTNALNFCTAGAERMRIDAIGDVRIGTASLGFHFDLSTQVFSTNFGDSGNLTLAVSNSSGSGVGGEIFLGGSTRGDTDRNCIVFKNGSSTERMRITAAGRLLVGGSADRGSNLCVGGTTDTARVIPQTDNVGYVGEASFRWQAIYAVNGSIQTSDEREKTEIKETTLGLDFIKDLKPVSYKWIDGEQQDKGKDEREHQGLIAQQVAETVEKHGVNKNDFGGLDIQKTEKYDDFHGMSYDQFVAPLIKAMQEQQTLIETLQREVQELKNNG